MKRGKIRLFLAAAAGAALLGGCGRTGDINSTTPAVRLQESAEEEVLETAEAKQSETEPADAAVPAWGEAAKQNQEDDFSDAVFIGDSRTEGLYLNTGLSEAVFYTAKGLMVDEAMSKPEIELDDGSMGTVLDALAQHQFGRVYVMFGVNELGWGIPEMFEDAYVELIREIKVLQPEAVIYVQSILPVSRELSDQDDIYNNENVARFTELARRAAESEQVVYLNVAEAVAAEDGSLPADASSDGVHLNQKYCRLWLDYLKAYVK